MQKNHCLDCVVVRFICDNFTSETHFVPGGNAFCGKWQKDVCLQIATVIFFFFFLSPLLYRLLQVQMHIKKFCYKKVLLRDRKRRNARAVACHGRVTLALFWGGGEPTVLSAGEYFPLFSRVPHPFHLAQDQ